MFLFKRFLRRNWIYFNQYNGDGIEVFQDLALTGMRGQQHWWNQIYRLPRHLIVNGTLDISGAPIKKLSQDLWVTGDFFACDTPLTALPTSFHAGGDIDLMGSMLKQLPDDLTVEGDLCVAYTPLRHLPVNLHVKGNLDLTCTNVRRLPQSLVVEGHIIEGDTFYDDLQLASL